MSWNDQLVNLFPKPQRKVGGSADPPTIKVVPLFAPALLDLKSRSGREPQAQAPQRMTLIDPLDCEIGFFETIPKRVRRLKDQSLKAKRWPHSLVVSGWPWGLQDHVWRIGGLWEPRLPPWALPLRGTVHEPIRAKVERILV
jgi:hypothetical protein